MSPDVFRLTDKDLGRTRHSNDLEQSLAEPLGESVTNIALPPNRNPPGSTCLAGSYVLFH